MNFYKAAIAVMTVLLLAVLLLGSYATAANAPIAFLLTADGQSESLTAWQDDAGDLYVFLPSYAQLEQLTVQRDLSVDGVLLRKGQSCESLRLGYPYAMDGHSGKHLTFVRSENLPALYIQTQSGSMDYIHRKKGNKETGLLHLYTPEGSLAYSGNLQSIQMRGNNCEAQEKEPYSLRLQAAADLLGMGSAEKWILLSNSFDLSHIRNKLIYDAAQEIGLAFSPQCQWADLYLNGEYAGLYLLSQRNEVATNRVTLENGTGFLVSQELRERLQDQNLPYFTTPLGGVLRIHFNNLDAHTMENIWARAERALTEDTDWTQWIDLDSWAKKFLIEEVFANLDGSHVSQFFYGGADGKIYAGPVWDYDIALGNPLHIPDPTLPILLTCIPPELSGSVWYYRLYENPEFFAYMTQVYEHQFLPLLQKLTEQGIDDYASHIQTSAQMNQLRWGTGSMEADVDNLKTFLRCRTDFLNRIWLEGEPYVLLTVVNHRDISKTYAIPTGTYIPQPLLEQPGQWYQEDRQTPFDTAQPITHSTTVYFLAELSPEDASQ